MSILSFLRRWKVLDPFAPGEIDQAETENALRDHDTIMSRIESIGIGVREAQGNLLASIQASKSTSESARQPPTDAIAQLLHDMKSSSYYHPRN